MLISLAAFTLVRFRQIRCQITFLLHCFHVGYTDPCYDSKCFMTQNGNMQKSWLLQTRDHFRTIFAIYTRKMMALDSAVFEVSTLLLDSEVTVFPACFHQTSVNEQPKR